MLRVTRFGLSYFALLTVSAVLSSRAVAQVVPDATLGPELSQLVVNGVTINDAASDLILGGAQRAGNLFHSFEQFSIREGQSVYFASPDGIARIFSRVTGPNVSDIYGTLGVDGGADLYLLNPNGIVFGPSARLDVGGSFVASTADAFEFAGAETYSARNPDVPPSLLTILPSAFQFGQVPPGEIVTQSVVNGVGLQVPDGESLMLLGGDVIVDGGYLSAYEGQITLGAIYKGAVRIRPSGQIIPDESAIPAQITIANGAYLDVASADSGNIVAAGRTIDISDSILFAGISGGFGDVDSRAGDIILTATESISLNGSNIINDIGTDAVGSGGNIEITAPVLEVLNGTQFSSSTRGEGDAGDVVIAAAEQVTFAGESPAGFVSAIFSTVGASGVGDGGNIKITTSVLEVLDGAGLLSSTFGEGDAGDVTFTAAERVTFAGEVAGEFSSGFVSIVLSSVETSGVGNGGNIEISAPVIEVLEGAELISGTRGEGDAGSVILTATERVTFAGEASDGIGSGAFSPVASSGVGRGGNIEIVAPVIEVLDGARLASNTFGEGDAGNIILMATEQVTLTGESSNGFVGGALSSVERSGVGQGGNIEITTSALEISAGARLLSSTFGDGDAGDIIINSSSYVDLDQGRILNNSNSFVGTGGDTKITAPLLILTNRSEITTQTLATDGGNITFDLENLLVLADNSLVSTEAGTSQAGGNGGDITINAQFIATNSRENSDIVANAFDGDGGNVNITATGGVFGITPRPERTPLSDITASSRNGVSGTIAIDSPNVDPSQDAAELPTDPVTAEVARSCREAYVQTGSEFIVTGRGGLPLGPLDSPASALWQDALPIEMPTPAPASETDSDVDDISERSRLEPAPISTPLVEVQGWIRNEQGQIELVAAPQQAAVGQPMACRDLTERRT